MPSYAINVQIDNQLVQFTESSGFPFIDQANRIQVPFRQTMEQFGCTVSWDSVKKMAIAKKNGITVQVPVGASYIIKNGKKITTDTAALIKENRVYLPIRAVLEAFDAQVEWDKGTAIVFVFTNNDTSPIYPDVSFGFEADGSEVQQLSNRTLGGYDPTENLLYLMLDMDITDVGPIDITKLTYQSSDRPVYEAVTFSEGAADIELDTYAEYTRLKIKLLQKDADRIESMPGLGDFGDGHRDLLHVQKGWVSGFPGTFIPILVEDQEPIVDADPPADDEE
jgi:hypothetical protein